MKMKIREAARTQHDDEGYPVGQRKREAERVERRLHGWIAIHVAVTKPGPAEPPSQSDRSIGKEKTQTPKGRSWAKLPSPGCDGRAVRNN